MEPVPAQQSEVTASLATPAPDKLSFFKKPLFFGIIFLVILVIGFLFLFIFLASPSRKLDKLTRSIDSLTASFGGRETPDFFQGSKREMRRKVESTKEALAKGDIEAARQNLLEVKKDIIRVGDPLKSKFVPKELKERHDPRDKYIQFDSVDPQVFEWYFGVIDILVEIDESY